MARKSLLTRSESVFARERYWLRSASMFAVCATTLSASWFTRSVTRSTFSDNSRRGLRRFSTMIASWHFEVSFVGAAPWRISRSDRATAAWTIEDKSRNTFWA